MSLNQLKIKMYKEERRENILSEEEIQKLQQPKDI